MKALRWYSYAALGVASYSRPSTLRGPTSAMKLLVIWRVEPSEVLAEPANIPHRDFVPWRFSVARRFSAPILSSCRRPNLHRRRHSHRQKTWELRGLKLVIGKRPECRIE